MPCWTFVIHVFVCYANYQTARTECCLAERNSAYVLVSTGISRVLDTCLSSIGNATYIVNSIVCGVILVRGSRVPAYRIRPTHGPIHILDMHLTGTKHIVRHSPKSGVQGSVISEFTCIYFLYCFRCGKCRRYMKYVQAKPSRLHCTQCGATYIYIYFISIFHTSSGVVNADATWSTCRPSLVVSTAPSVTPPTACPRTAASSSTRNSSVPSMTLRWSSGVLVLKERWETLAH